MESLGINVNREALSILCERWKIDRLKVFGSLVRDDYGPDSDIDLLVEFRPDSNWSLFDLLTAESEFSGFFGRRADMVQPAQLKWVIRDRVLAQAQELYAA